MQIASLDIGTNTVLLLIVEAQQGAIRVIRDDHAIARLGEGVDRTKRISEEAYQRFVVVLGRHLATIEEFQVDKIAAVGTSVLRDAENREEIVERTQRETGIEIEILSGGDEARWTYRGSLGGIYTEGDVGVLDIGGGSTEISWGNANMFLGGASVDIGAVRITERCFSTNPITAGAAEEAREIIRTALRSIEAPTIRELISVAGTPTTLAAMHQGLTHFDRHKVHGYRLRREAIDQLLDVVLRVDTKTLLEHYPAVSKARADILPAGTLILREAMDILQVRSVDVSTHGLRYGIAIREAERVLGGAVYSIIE